MLITWMAYAALFGAMLAIGALAAERVVALWGGARRAVWAAAGAIGMVAPIALALGAARTSSAVESADTRVSLPLPAHLADAAPSAQSGATRTALAVSSLTRAASRWTAQSDRYALAVWIGSSLVLLAAFGRGLANVRRKRASWNEASVNGCDVLVADDVGPAVIGSVRPAVVLPRWALAADRDEQILMLRHEHEHIAANDPLLLHAGALALILFPWNAALWFVVHRLRLAVEIDCDARVLRAGARPRDYGLLLLSVGARHAVSLPFVAPLAERRPLLEHRILAMTTIRPARPLRASLPFIAIVAVVAAAAAQTPRPAPLPIAAAAPATAARERAPVRAGVPARMAVALSPRPVAAARLIPGAPVIPASPATAASPAAAPSPTRPAAIAQPKPSASAPTSVAEIPLEVIRDWIARHHPGVIAGDTMMNLVTIVVDANDQYVRSVVDHAPSNTIDFRSVLAADLLENVEVLKGPAAAAVYGPNAANGVIVIKTKKGIADPARAALDTGAAMGIVRAIQRSGIAAGKNIDNAPLFIVDGIVVTPPISTPSAGGQPGDLEARLGITRDAIASVDVLKLAPGRIGPNALGVVIVKLKG